MKVDPSGMAKIGTVDPRYLSWNVEMVEVTGGRFWKPFSSAAESASATEHKAGQPAGLDPNLFEYRPPIDLANPRLRKLAGALKPSYVRVSGTWANSTYFQDDDNPPLSKAPEGFNGVLTRAEWKGVVDFSKTIDAPIVTSVAVSVGTRGADGVWEPAQAKAVFDFTKKLGGTIAATEFMNEPTILGIGGAPANYNATEFGRDAKVFEGFLRKELPSTLYLGPGSTAEGLQMTPRNRPIKLTPSTDLLEATGPIFDVFSYHFYGGVSRRCGGGTTVDQALTPEWLDRTDKVEAFYRDLRDKYLPGKQMWLNETAEAACGGDEIAGQFVDTFRFLNQLGTLAQKGVQVVMHNTLASSDYGLLDQHTLEPRPDYWAAVLWKRLMGPVVLDPGKSEDASVRIYAHCTPGKNGGVALVALNTDKEGARTITLPAAAERYTLTADGLTSTKVMLNGKVLDAAQDGSLPGMRGEHIKAGSVDLPAASVTFLAIPSAGNQSCR